LKHQINIGSNSFLRSIISGSFSGNEFTADRFVDMDTPNERIIKYTEVDDSEIRLTLSSLFNSKINNRSTFRAGILIENYQIESLLRDREKQPDNNNDGDPDLFTFRDVDENLTIAQHYAQIQYRLTEKLTLNAGLHGLFSTLNEQFVVEPRASVSYGISPNQTVNIGYGLHHQPVPLPLLFL